MELKHHIMEQHLDAISLLIVPYGIETIEGSFGHIFKQTFNRTLWN